MYLVEVFWIMMTHQPENSCCHIAIWRLPSLNSTSSSCDIRRWDHNDSSIPVYKYIYIYIYVLAIPLVKVEFAIICRISTISWPRPQTKLNQQSSFGKTERGPTLMAKCQRWRILVISQIRIPSIYLYIYIYIYVHMYIHI